LRKAQITGVTVTGSGDEGMRIDGKAIECVDIYAPERPRVENLTCGTSGGVGPARFDGWGICRERLLTGQTRRRGFSGYGYSMCRAVSRAIRSP
jgi:hypothetical protein